MSDRNIQGFDIEEKEHADLLYALMRTIMNGTRTITNVERTRRRGEAIEGEQNTVYITSEKSGIVLLKA